MNSPDLDSLRIGEVAKATGVPVGTLRTWERRFGFPEHEREPSGHRRYGPEQIERIETVLRERDRGLSVAAAIERADRGPDGVPSLYARLRRRHPDLAPVVVEKRYLIPLSHAVEEESAARAERSLLIGSFQRERFYRQSEQRWRELSRGAERAFVFADFPRLRQPRSAPVEIPIDRSEPLSREWGVICLAPEHSACLIAWEPPARQPVPDCDRCFELLFSVEPAVVREAVAGAAELAAAAAPKIAAACMDRLQQTADANPRSQVRLAAAITARFIAGRPGGRDPHARDGQGDTRGAIEPSTFGR